MLVAESEAKPLVLSDFITPDKLEEGLNHCEMQLINSALKFLECRESEPLGAAVIRCVNGAEALGGHESVC